MADIDVARKSGMGWLWALLGLTVLALLAWLILRGTGDRVAGEPAIMDEAAEVAPPPIESPTEPMATSAAASPALQEYLGTCAERAPEQMAVDHAYTSGCVQRLVNAIEPTLSQTTASAQGELESARQAADRLAQTAQDAAHSEMTRNAFLSIATLLNRIQDDRFPNLDSQATQLQQTAERVTPTEPLLQQRTAVQDFFRQAGDLLRGMTAA